MAETVDTLFLHCKELVTLADGPPTGARRGEAMQQLGVVPDGAIAVRDGCIIATGPTEAIARRYRAEEELDLSGYVVLPGFVDCHTHPVFVQTREQEFHQRCAGADYMAIAKAGGGILSSMQAVRKASPEQLTAATLQHLWGFLQHGTTTAECKSGYGLSTAAELASLKALGEAADEVPLTIKRTFLGAHEFPPEYRDNRDAYVELLIHEMLPAVAPLCDYCDVFAEPAVFDRTQSLRVLSAARAEGLRLRLHADELQPMAGAELAVELQADSADHLGRISAAGIAALAGSNTTAVLLPGTGFLLGVDLYPPARRMVEAGCAIALATDFNPGSCYTQSMTLVMTLACVKLKLRPDEVITACTINPAFSLQLDDQVGSLHAGKRADFVALDLPSWRAVGYVFGSNPVVLTVKAGRPVIANLADRLPDLFAGGAEIE